MKTAIVTGAGGFIGGHLTKRLIDEGYYVRAADVKPIDEWHQVPDCTSFYGCDLRLLDNCYSVFRPAEEDMEDIEVYNLAADMGGMGFIETHKADCMLSVLISTNMLVAANKVGVKSFFYSSSACVYNADKQNTSTVHPLKESDAYPAMPEDGYGWEKLFSERMGRHFMEDFGLRFRTARYHNVYGPHGTFDGGREKAPAAICRKVIESKLSGDHTIEIWGDGNQTRSFMYIDDCVEGTRRIMESDVDFPINLGSSELVSINQLVYLVEEIAGLKLKRTYKLDAPKGVRGRNSDNSLIKQHLNWEPSTKLRDGMERTYAWIWDQMTNGVKG